MGYGVLLLKTPNINFKKTPNIYSLSEMYLLNTKIKLYAKLKVMGENMSKK